MFKNFFISVLTSLALYGGAGFMILGVILTRGDLETLTISLPILLVIILVVYFILRIYLKEFIWPYLAFMIPCSILFLPLWLIISTKVFSAFRQSAGTEKESSGNIMSKIDTIFKLKRRSIYQGLLSISESSITANQPTELINQIIQTNSENHGIKSDLIKNK